MVFTLLNLGLYLFLIKLFFFNLSGLEVFCYIIFCLLYIILIVSSQTEVEKILTSETYTLMFISSYLNVTSKLIFADSYFPTYDMCFTFIAWKVNLILIEFLLFV